MDWGCAIAVDVGGTFTDLVLTTNATEPADPTDVARRQLTAKVPSVPSDPSAGVFAAIEAAAAQLHTTPNDLLSRCHRFVHGTTVATNAVLTRNLASVGLITTAGFRDTLEIRRGIRDDQWDHRAPWPPVLVPRSLRLGVGGRIGVDGTELEPLALDDVESAIAIFRGHDVEAVAICLLHSYRDDRHEAAAAELLRGHWPGALTTVSSELVPHLGEYARTSTAVVNAGLVPIVGRYLDRLADGLRGLGLTQPLLLLQSNGGTVPVSAVERRPVDLVLSGPAAVGSATQALAAGDEPLVTMEIGGTSCDVAVAVRGTVPVVDGIAVGGYHLDVPAVDVHTVGAGGGTIARVDGAGMLRVGPEGAGAHPGPACYGLGGTSPTATDVHLRLGRLRPGPYADGSIALDPILAERAIDEGVAHPLGLDTDAAAIGVLLVLEQHLHHAVQTITIQRGRDPGGMTLVAAGGAGGLHGSSVARMLGCHRLVVPAAAGVFCALGMLDSALRRDMSRSASGTLDDVGADGVVALATIEQRRAEKLIASDWPPVEIDWSSHVDLRYPGQLWSVRVGLDAATADAATTAGVRAAFEAEYLRLYGHIQPDGVLEVTGVGVTATGRLDRAGRPTAAARPDPQPVEHRRCWVDAATGWADVAVYDSTALGPGATIDGPYIVEAATTTVLGTTGDRLTVAANGDLQVELT